MGRLKKEALKVSKTTKAQAEDAVKKAGKNVKISKLPPPPSGTYYHRNSDGTIDIREINPDGLKIAPRVPKV